jgi:hypothetical protein
MLKAICQEIVTDGKEISVRKSGSNTGEKFFSTYVQGILVAVVLGLAKYGRTPIGQEKNWIIGGIPVQQQELCYVVICGTL